MLARTALFVPVASNVNGWKLGDRFLRNGAAASRALLHRQRRCTFACEMIGDPLGFLASRCCALRRAIAWCCLVKRAAALCARAGAYGSYIISQDDLGPEAAGSRTRPRAQREISGSAFTERARMPYRFVHILVRSCAGSALSF